MRESGDERYVWTTGSWLLYEYLEQATPQDRKRMEQAIAKGDIAWHALPFSWQTEMMHAVDDRRRCRPVENVGPTFWTHYDWREDDRRAGTYPRYYYPSRFSRCEVSRYRRERREHAGATSSVVCVESSSWLDTGGHVSPWLRGVTRVPDSDLAVAIVVRDDNSGPHTPEEIAATYPA